MLRSLLEEQFGLETHQQEQQATVYAMVVPKGQAKLKKAEESERAGCKPDPGAAPVSGNAAQMVALSCKNTTMTEFATNAQQWAGGYIDHPVTVVDHLDEKPKSQQTIRPPNSSGDR